MSLSTYLTDYIGEFIDALKWSSVPTSVTTETLLAYGVATEALATDTTKLYSLGRVKLWEEALRTDELPEAVYELIKANLELCTADALQYLPYYTPIVYNQEPTQDPYSSNYE